MGTTDRWQLVKVKFYSSTSSSGTNWIYVSSATHIVYNTFSYIQYFTNIDLPNATAYAGTKWQRVKLLFALRSKGLSVANNVGSITFDKYDYQVGSGTEYSMERIGWLAMDGGESNA